MKVGDDARIDISMTLTSPLPGGRACPGWSRKVAQTHGISGCTVEMAFEPPGTAP